MSVPNSFILQLTLCIFIQFFTMTSSVVHNSKDGAKNNLREKLSAEERNAMCCAKNQKCCKRPTTYPRFEIKTFLVDCPNIKCNKSTNTRIIVQNPNTNSPESITNCLQKLLLTVKITNRGAVTTKNQYIIIDHVIEPETHKKVRILNPYVLRLKQEPILQVYSLEFERVVNAEAKEVVHNKHNHPNYGGCDTGPQHPTCGVIKHKGKVVPFSAGFCCSCSPEKNRRMQPYEETPPASAAMDDSFSAGEVRPVKRQRRGGQSCDDINQRGMPESFHESAHCLVFSKLWYSVYNLQRPRVVHKVKAQIFRKYEDCHGRVRWRDLNNGKVLNLGSENPNCMNTESSVIGTYTGEELNSCNMALNYRTHKILIPEKRMVDPGQFMVIPKKVVSTDGKTCNSIGVGYEAFYKQSKRCSSPKGSCLANQPQHFHMHDAEAEKQGQKGFYFLKFFGNLPENPVERNGSGFENNVKLLYNKQHVSTLYFEIRADSVTLLQPSVLASITEVYIDATSPKRTNIIVKVTNAGLVYGVFYVRLGDCPMSIPAAFNNIASKSVLISPQKQHIFKLSIEYPLPQREFLCSVFVHNMNQELLAVRRIRFVRNDRCICMWHCKCQCYLADSGLKCKPMPLEEYQAAGFQGGLPVATHVVKPSYLDELLAMSLHMFLFLFLTLLLMGLIKALLGLCFLSIGLWGLNLILGIEEGNSDDFVCDNRDCEVNKQNRISVSTQFCLNVLFFFLYPLALINIAINKLCFSSYTDECECSELLQKISYDSKCKDPNCPSSDQNAQEGGSGRRDSSASRRDSLGSRRDSLGSRRDSLGSRRDSLGSRRDSIGSRRDSASTIGSASTMSKSRSSKGSRESNHSRLSQTGSRLSTASGESRGKSE